MTPLALLLQMPCQQSFARKQLRAVAASYQPYYLAYVIINSVEHAICAARKQFLTPNELWSPDPTQGFPAAMTNADAALNTPITKAYECKLVRWIVSAHACPACAVQTRPKPPSGIEVHIGPLLLYLLALISLIRCY